MVKVENIIVDMSKYILEFQCNEKIIISNCEITGGNNFIFLSGAKEITFQDCSFHNFSVPVIFINTSMKEVKFNGCRFIDCIGLYDDLSRTSEKGVVSKRKNVNVAGCFFENCEFQNCGSKGKNYSYNPMSNVICSFATSVKKCKFYNCWNYNKNENVSYDSALFNKYTNDSFYWHGENSFIQNENEIINSAII